MRLIAAIGVLSLITACGDSYNEDRETSTINKSNAQTIVNQAITGDQNLSIVRDTLPNEGKTNNFSNKNKAIVYCGTNPFEDTGNGSMDINLSGTLPADYTFDIAFDQCQFIETTTFNGGYTFNLSGDGLIGPIFGEGENTITQTFDSLSLVETTTPLDLLAVGTVTSNNNYTGTTFTSNDTLNLEIAYNETAIAFSDWVKVIELDTEASLFTMTLNGTVDISSQNGAFTIATLEPLVFDANGEAAEFIISGKFQLTAEDNSSVIVTVLDSTQVQLDIDENGDGIIDETLVIDIADLNLLSMIDLN
ncbi:hypothetical protein [Pleionea sediminis]|uniref:hypothetical protein n=1 Tax=Pleionea sediminis TaxID=2569479 RepID=UPI001184B21E|nr:hypothetical protein [Pleionea sediminis]